MYIDNFKGLKGFVEIGNDSLNKKPRLLLNKSFLAK